MPPKLEEWQEHLDRQFKGLAAARAASGLPVFAFEHGLDAGQRSDIFPLLIDTLKTGERLSKNWLIWVVYATELGYRYAGDQLWDTFDEKTQHWRRSYDGDLRDWFMTIKRA